MGRRVWHLWRVPIYYLRPAPSSHPHSALKRTGSFPGLCFASLSEPARLVPVSWQHSWQELLGTVLKRHLWAEQMRTEGTELDMVPCCSRAESEGNPCPSQSQDVAEASWTNTLGPSGLQTVLEIFTNTKFACYFTGKADPGAIFPLAVLVCFSSGPSAWTITAICPWAYEAKLMILLNIQTLTHT